MLHIFALFYVVCVVVSKNAEDDMYIGLDKYQENYDLPKLAYKYDALEPWIDELTVKTHHSVIMAEYANKLNNVLQEWRESKEEEKLSKTSLLNIFANIESVPEKWRTNLINYGGGYLSHIFYFAVLNSNPSGEEKELPDSLKIIFNRSFHNFTHFKDWVGRDACKHFGAGHIWLIRVPRGNYLTIYTTVEEVTPLHYKYQPIVALDLWEHAYFIKHQNNRKKYVESWWKVVDWKKVDRLFKWWKQFDPKHDEL